MQGGDPAVLPIGTHVSAKYKGAYCEAKVKSIDKQVKLRVTLKGPNGNNGASLTIRDKDIISIMGDGPLMVSAIAKIKLPDSGGESEATVKQIMDQSRYTVIFNDGDIATLKRNALCMKSGKHFNASESLDNLPLTHPEHFSSPASMGGGGSRGSSNKKGGGTRVASTMRTTMPLTTAPAPPTRKRRTTSSTTPTPATLAGWCGPRTLTRRPSPRTCGFWP